jgi:hypothetical protein
MGGASRSAIRSAAIAVAARAPLPIAIATDRTAAAARLSGPALEDDARELPAVRIESDDLLVADADARGGELFAFACTDSIGAVGAQQQVGAPRASEKGEPGGPFSPRVEGDRLVGNLPAVAEDAVDDRATPQRREAGNLWRVVAKPVREQDRTHADARHALGTRDCERRAGSIALEIEHLGVDDLDARQLSELAAAGAPE